mmetsp:Transcript_8809/g.16382  ORF Transcript_8809/g.16382 Transcript_8809/m.16382 type:complete len:575 (-) Transcript_8809:141-1865(-)
MISLERRGCSLTFIAKQAKFTLIPLCLYWASMIVSLLIFIVLSRASGVVAFQPSAPYRQHVPMIASHRSKGGSIASELFASASEGDVDDAASTVAVRAADLDDSLGLTPDERTVVNVHRVCKDSVVYVTSVRKINSNRSVDGGRRRRRRRLRSDRWQQREKEESEEEPEEQRRALPKGIALGSGSGFVVDSEGYIITNYHVIQRAYESNQDVIRYDKFWDGIATNTTKRMKKSMLPLGGDTEITKSLENFINGTVTSISGRDSKEVDGGRSELPAQVFVRFGTNGDGDATSQSSSSASYHLCEIIDVVKELDVAVLRISKAPPSLKALRYGTSSDLLVGQSLLAIGNPFGLDRTLSSGLVSALGRSITGVAGNDIKNCIQTDAAINPGNSGGPLLNLSGEVVGVNTMIISTSGSNAGIGFAVPGDSVKESTDIIIDLDKERRSRNTNRKGRGWLGADVATGALEASFRQRLAVSSTMTYDEDGVGAFLTALSVGSPLLEKPDGHEKSIETTSIANGNIRLGDRVVNVGGNQIANGNEFVSEMKRRVEGEQLSLTVQNTDGEKRVEYVTLGRIPL